MTTLFGRSTSINVRKVQWTFDELGLAYDHVPSAGPDLHTPEFLAMSPSALIPVLLDGELVLTESNAICRYLAAREGRDDLLPSEPAARAIVEQWMDWQATELNTSWRYAFLSLMRKSPAHQDPAALAASIASWNRHMTIVDGRLAATGAWLAGPTFTLADIVVGVAAHRWKMTPIERDVLPAVDAWMTRLAQRAPFAVHCADTVP